MSADQLYSVISKEHGPALTRLAVAYEADPDKRRDLLQEIHLEVWRSLSRFEGRCSLRTWIYRVAHNTGVAHIVRQKRIRTGLISLEELDDPPNYQTNPDSLALERLSGLVQRLKPLDRQIIVLWLEGTNAADTGEITGLSPANVAMKVHRIKDVLKRWFHEGPPV